MEKINKIKVLFLVMYSGEGDYEKSIESAKEQHNIDPSFYIVKNLPMQEAHLAIYSYWNEHSNEFDMFVKLDADFVLTDNYKIYSIWQTISNTNIASSVIWVHDFLRNRLIPGLVVGTKHCRFNLDNVKAKAQFDTNVYLIDDSYIRNEYVSGILVPAALHGYYSYPIQLFAQGVKRRIRQQNDVYHEASNEFKKAPENLRFMFLIGWQLGGSLLSNDYNYTDNKFIEYFTKVDDLVNTTNHKFDVSFILNKLQS